MTTCLSWSCSVLKVWKNASCVSARPCRNWMSSMSRMSTSRYRAWKAEPRLFAIELMKSFVNSSLET